MSVPWVTLLMSSLDKFNNKLSMLPRVGMRSDPLLRLKNLYRKLYKPRRRIQLLIRRELHQGASRLMKILILNPLELKGV